MTRNYHTPIPYAAAGDSDVVNSPLGELDAQITATQAALTAALATIGRQVIYAPTELSVAAPSISLPSIPATYSELELICHLRTSDPGVTDNLFMQFNGDTTNANYFSAGANYLGTTGPIKYSVNGAQPGVYFTGQPLANGAPSDHFTFIMIYIGRYASTSREKDVIFRASQQEATSGAAMRYALGGGHWNDTDAISSIVLLPENGPNFMAGSRYALYGLL